jgi:hypothetical protein
MRARLASLVLVGVVMISAALAADRAARAAGSLNGVAGTFPAYYDHQLFTINFKRFDQSQGTLLDRNSQQNTIYQSDAGLPGGQPFVSVIDAILADGFNPLWAEVQITFTAGHTPRQLFSDNEVLDAAAAGEITLTPTNEMYRCSVIGAAPRLTAPLTGATRAPLGTASSAAAAPDASKLTWGALKALFR